MDIEWDRLCGPYFGDEIATLTLDGRRAAVRIEKAGLSREHEPELTPVVTLPLS
jgi:hypothetical protein